MENFKFLLKEGYATVQWERMVHCMKKNQISIRVCLPPGVLEVKITKKPQKRGTFINKEKIEK